MSKFLFIVITSFLLTACGGSKNSTPTPVPPPAVTPPVVTPPVVTPPVVTPPAPVTNVSGVITGFGSVFVNGVEYDTTATNVSTDNNSAASENDLQVGMIISLKGTVNSDGTTGAAETIHYEAQIIGPLDSIDLIANSMIILGQTVLFDDLTSLDNVVLSALNPGDNLEISGFFNSAGQIYATRIEKKTTLNALKIEGAISQLDTSAKSFHLANMVINYASASYVNLTEQDLANNLAVRVKGDASALVNNVFTVSQIKIEAKNSEHQEGDNRQLEGAITSLDSTAKFMVNDTPVLTDTNTEYEHGTVNALVLNARIKIKGSYDASGNLLAKNIRFHQRSELTLEGAVQAINLDLKTLTVLGVTFTTDDQTKMRDESDQGDRFFKLADLAVGDFVDVKGFVDSKGDNLATKLLRKNEQVNTDTELKGQVSHINNFGFIVVGVTVDTNSATLFQGVNGNNVDQATFFAQLKDAMHVVVKGQTANNVYTASKVEIDEESVNNGDHNGNSGDHNGNSGEHRTEFRGTVEQLLNNSFVVSGHTVLLNSTTTYKSNDILLAADQFWALVKVGDQIKVKGTKDATTGVITAKQVSLEIEHQDNVAEISLQAAGTLIDNVLTVKKHTIKFDVNTHFESLTGTLTQTEFLAQASQWQNFNVEGILRNDVIVANKISQKQADDPSNTVELSAFIEAFIDNGITVAGHQVQFSNTSQYFKGDTTLTHNEFIAQAAVNSKVSIQGILSFIVQSDGSELEVITANKVTLKVSN